MKSISPNPATPGGISEALASRRIREIPYNYTSFSDREIVIRFLGEETWRRARHPARAAPHRALGAHAVRGAGRHVGDHAQPVHPGRPHGEPEALGVAHARAASPPRPDPGARRGQRTRAPARGRGARGGAPVRGLAAGAETIAPPGAQAAGARHAPRQHRLRRHGARVARHRRQRLARRAAVRGHHARHRGRSGAHRARLHRPRAHHHPARRRHRLHRQRRAAVRRHRHHQHREARSPGRGGAARPARRGAAGADRARRGRRGHAARRGNRRGNRVTCSRSIPPRRTPPPSAATSP